MSSYYGRPVIKEPVWTWEIPAYFFFGGLGGASAVLGLAARVGRNEPLARTSTYVGAAADLVSPALLVSDLGRPERFLNMFRVFKVTSPMSVGSWLLAVSGGASSTAALLEAVGRFRAVKLAAEVVSAAAGGPLATYTGGLVADTAVPAWHGARRQLPYLFGASAAASAGAAATLLLPPRDAGPARRLAIGATVAELAAAQAMERQLGPLVSEPYRQGAAGKLMRTARVCAAAGAGLLSWKGRRSRAAAVAGSSLLLAGEVALRFAVWRAGSQSARDPRYTVIPQRQRLEQRGLPARPAPARP